MRPLLVRFCLGRFGSWDGGVLLLALLMLSRPLSIWISTISNSMAARSEGETVVSSWSCCLTFASAASTSMLLILCFSAIHKRAINRHFFDDFMLDLSPFTILIFRLRTTLCY